MLASLRTIKGWSKGKATAQQKRGLDASQRPYHECCLALGIATVKRHWNKHSQQKWTVEPYLSFLDT
jgi:hypothetical protein